MHFPTGLTDVHDPQGQGTQNSPHLHAVRSSLQGSWQSDLEAKPPSASAASASMTQPPFSRSVLSQDQQSYSRLHPCSNQSATHSARHPTHLQPSPDIFLAGNLPSAAPSLSSDGQVQALTQSCSGQPFWEEHAVSHGGMCSEHLNIQSEPAYATAQAAQHHNTVHSFGRSGLLDTLHAALAR